MILYRLLKESCEYLGEHSRKREEHSRRDQQKNSGDATGKRAENREVAKEIRSRRESSGSCPEQDGTALEQGWDRLCLKRLSPT